MTPAANYHSTRSVRRGFNLLELLMVVAIISMLAALVMPAMTSDARLRLDAATTVMISDIELAQVMNISAPKDPVVMRFDPGANAYWLAYEDSPDDPIIREGTDQPYRVVIGQGRAQSATGVRLSVSGLDDGTMKFSPHGGLADLDATPRIALRVSGADTAIQISISPTTGSIRTQQIVVDEKLQEEVPKK